MLVSEAQLPDGCAYNDSAKYSAFKESNKHHRKVYRDDIVNAAAVQLQAYTALHADLPFKSKIQRSLEILLKRKRNGMSFGPSMVADFLLYIVALKSYLARLFLQWKTNAFTALLPTSTTNSD